MMKQNKIPATLHVLAGAVTNAVRSGKSNKIPLLCAAGAAGVLLLAAGGAFVAMRFLDDMPSEQPVARMPDEPPTVPSPSTEEKGETTLPSLPEVEEETPAPPAAEYDANAPSSTVVPPSAETPPAAYETLQYGEAQKYGEAALQGDADAYMWLVDAEEQGNVQAIHYLALMATRGLTNMRGEPDTEMAIEWYQKAAQGGYADSQLALGKIYRDGIMLEKDDTQAAHWFRKAAEQGNAEAQMALADCYELGVGVTKDEAAAAAWRRKAQEAGYSSPVEESVPIGGFTKNSNAGIAIICSYAGADVIHEDIDDESVQKEKIADQVLFSIGNVSLPVTRTLRMFGTPSEQEGPTLVKYTRVSDVEAKLNVMQLWIQDQEAADKINATVSDLLNIHSEEVLLEEIGSYVKDWSETITLTMTSPTEGTASAHIVCGSTELHISNIRIRVESCDPPEDAVAEDSAPSSPAPGNNFEAEVDSFIVSLQNMSCRKGTELYQKRLLTLLPLIRERRDVNLTLPETKGNAALHYACGLGYAELVKWLLSNGADVNKRTDRGATPAECIGADPDGVIRRLLLGQAAEFAPSPQAPGAASGISVRDKELHNQAMEAYHRGDFIQAAHLFQQLSQQVQNQHMKQLTAYMHAGMYVQHGVQCMKQGRSAEAETYLLKGARLGCAEGYAVLGGMFFTGQGVPPDRAKGIQYYRTGAQLGDPNCQQSLRTLRLRW